MCQNRNILVVDDEPLMRKIIALWCERAGFKVTLAEDGIEALEFAAATSYCLIITDYQMPRMKGFEFCEQLRSFPRHQGTPVIMISSIAEKLDQRTVQRLGLILRPKPLSQASLVQLVLDTAKPLTFQQG